MSGDRTGLSEALLEAMSELVTDCATTKRGHVSVAILPHLAEVVTDIAEAHVAARLAPIEALAEELGLKGWPDAESRIRAALKAAR